MSFQTIALAEGGVVVGYNGFETSGTALADFSGNSLPATLSTRGALSGAAIPSNASRSITASGNAGTGAVATRAVAGGSPLQLVTTMTYCAFVQGSAATPPAVGGMLGERANNFLSRRTTSRIHQVYPYIGGVLQSSRPLTAKTVMASGERFLLWFRKHADGWWDIGTNDGIEDAYWYSGDVTATTDSLQIGTSSNQAFDGLMFPFAVFDHAVDLGVFRAMIREDTTMDYGATNGIGSVLFDHAGDLNTIIAGSTSDTVCRGMYCGARIRAYEARVTDSAGRVYHIGCRTSKSKGHPSSITSSTSQLEYAQAIDRSIRLLVNMWAHKANATKDSWWDGTAWREAANPSAVFWHNECGVGCATAALARYLKTSPNDPLMQVAYKCMQMGLAHDNTSLPSGASWWDNADFSLPHVGKMLVLMAGRMDAGQWSDWKDQFLAGVDDYCITGGPIVETGGSRGPGGGFAVPYYINGNREMGVLETLWLAWYLDPSSTRLGQYQSQRSWVATPAAGSFQPGGVSSGLTFGLVTAVAPVNADGSDGRGWFREAHSTGIKGFWNNGGVVEGDINKETVNVDGYDPSYTVLQMERCTNLFTLSGEQVYAKWGNMLLNQAATDLNTTTGIFDGSYGSRHSANFTWQQSTGLVHKWRGQRATTGTFTDTILAGLFKITQSQFSVHGRDPTQPTGRDVMGSNATALLMGLDTWPGH